MIVACSRSTPLLSSGFLRPGSSPREVRRLTATPADWVTRVRLDPEGRWYEQIPVDDSASCG